MFSLRTKQSILRPFFFIGSFLVPKKKDFWVFYPTHYDNKFEGNIKAVFDHAIKNYPNIDLFCIGIPSDIVNENPYLNGRSNNSKFNLASVWKLLRAEVIFIDDGNVFFIGNFNIVELWHGIGFKKIYNLNKNSKKKKKYYSQFLFAIAGSINDQKRKVESFYNDNVYIVGNPRNDFLWADKKHVFSDYTKVITYAPTFRSTETTPFSPSFIEELQKFLYENNYLFLLQKHPNDKSLYVPSGCPNIRLASDFTNDVQELLKSSDILISDYSSISVDFSLLKKPIIFYMYDCSKEFLRDNFYYDLNTVLPGPIVFDQQELLEKISNTDWFDDKDYQENYKRFVEFFHKYQDDKASARTVDLVISKMKER